MHDWDLNESFVAKRVVSVDEDKRQHFEQVFFSYISSDLSLGQAISWAGRNQSLTRNPRIAQSQFQSTYSPTVESTGSLSISNQHTSDSHSHLRGWVHISCCMDRYVVAIATKWRSEHQSRDINRRIGFLQSEVRFSCEDWPTKIIWKHVSTRDTLVPSFRRYKTMQE